MKKPPVLPALFLALTLIGSTPASAGVYGNNYPGETSLETIAERELARRQEGVVRAKDLMDEAAEAFADGDCEVAFAKYRKAADLLPAGTETGRQRAKAVNGMCDSGICLAKDRIANGRFGDAEAILKLILQDEYDPKCYEAIQVLAHLEDPDYYNHTVTPKFVAQIEEVKKLLLEGEQYYQTGQYDKAIKRYDQVLNIDPYNIAARKGQEMVNKKRQEYGIDAYNEARSRMMWELDKAWQSPVRKYGVEGGGPIEQRKIEVRTNEAIQRKLDRIIIPQVNFREATVREAIEFLKQKSAELDVTEPDPSRRGVNIVLKLESAGGLGALSGAAEPAIPGVDSSLSTGSLNAADRRITLQLKSVPLREALKYITSLAGLKYKVDPYAVAIVPQSEPTDVLITKEYKVPPGFISSVPTAAQATESASPFGGGGFATGGTGETSVGSTVGKMAGRATAKDFLEANGVTFPPGASANFLPASSRLIVRNTQENLDLVDTLVDAAIGAAPSQVEVEAKFVEITEENLKELSFDWLLGQANIPGNQNVFFGGGTSGTSAEAIDSTNFPFVPPGGTPVGTYPITAGLRSGQLGISQTAIDALLFGVSGASATAPGAFAVAGVFTDPQFQLVIRALNQKRGVDLLSAPKVTTKSGQRAVIEIIRELRYPTEFDPPQIPQEFGSSSTGQGVGLSSASNFPVTPTTPTAFETRNTGVTLEVEPVVGPDGYTIDLNLVPQVVEFEGFINYGSPILTNATNALGIPTQVVLTNNVINQPVFSTRKVTTSVSVWDGQTVVLGGLMREDIQKVEDKVPLLGDIPIIGRAFRSQIDQHLKRNLVIFVTARLMNPAGEPVLQVGDEEEVVEPIAPPELPLPVLPEPSYSK